MQNLDNLAHGYLKRIVFLIDNGDQDRAVRIPAKLRDPDIALISVNWSDHDAGSNMKFHQKSR